MTDEVVHVDLSDHVLTITMDRKTLAARSDAGQDRSTSAVASPEGPTMMGRKRKPLIGCVEGQAYAGGMELLLT